RTWGDSWSKKIRRAEPRRPARARNAHPARPRAAARRSSGGGTESRGERSQSHKANAECGIRNAEWAARGRVRYARVTVQTSSPRGHVTPDGTPPTAPA